jgi:hypothetical protein
MAVQAVQTVRRAHSGSVDGTRRLRCRRAGSPCVDLLEAGAYLLLVGHHGDEVPSDSGPQRFQGEDVGRVSDGDDRGAELAADGHRAVAARLLDRQDRGRGGIYLVAVEVYELEVVLTREQSERGGVSHALFTMSLPPCP